MPSAWPEGRLYCDTLISLADFLESILVDALFTCLCVHESLPITKNISLACAL